MIIFTYHTIHALPRNRKAKINPKNIFIVIFSVLFNFLKNILDENVKKKSLTSLPMLKVKLVLILNFINGRKNQITKLILNTQYPWVDAESDEKNKQTTEVFLN